MSEKRSKSGEFFVEPGRIYHVGDPEHVGIFPVKTELTVLDADPAKTPVGWTVQEYVGGDVILVDEAGEVIEPYIKDRDGLKVGQLLIAETLVGKVRAVVARDEVGDWCWVSDHMVGDLEYDESQGRWVTTLAINKKLLSGV